MDDDYDLLYTPFSIQRSVYTFTSRGSRVYVWWHAQTIQMSSQTYERLECLVPIMRKNHNVRALVGLSG